MSRSDSHRSRRGYLQRGGRGYLRRGGRLRWWTAFLRAACCTLVPIGLLWCAVSRRNRSLQDLLLGTRVIYEWRPREVLDAAVEQSSPRDDAPGRAAHDREDEVTRKD